MGRPPVLVIGYGSELRRDDAAGLRAVDEIERRRLPRVECHSVTQLTPELSASIVGRDAVYFIDAVRGGTRSEPVRLTAATLSGMHHHVSDPKGILSLAAQLYRSEPEAWLITIPGYDFEVGMGLSPGTQLAVLQAVGEFEQRIIGDRSLIGAP